MQKRWTWLLSVVLIVFSAVNVVAQDAPDATMTIELTPVGSYATGVFDDGAAEIVAYDAANQRLVIVNASQGTSSLDLVSIADPANPTLFATIRVAQFGVANSVAVYGDLIAVAVENAEDATQPGSVLFYSTDATFLVGLAVGSLPDMITFTPDGQKVLVANEGEPNSDYSVDPPGSISIIDVSGDVAALTNEDVITLGFDDYNPGGRLADALPAGVRVFGPNATPSTDLEPEYIAVSPDSTRAFVSLQENNAVAVLDLTTNAIVSIIALGYKEHSDPANAIDASDRDGGINIAPYPVRGMYMPDAIAVFEHDGALYFVTANEGDAREYETFDEQARVADLTLDPEAFPNAAELQDEAVLGRLRVTTTLGDPDGDGAFNTLYSFGARSFTIWDAAGTLIYDSGSDFERITADLAASYFNSNGTDATFDTRSDDKGPEPEGVVVGEIDGRRYAFIGLERTGGVMVYDITDPAAPVFVQYANNATPEGNPEDGTAGDVGPEGLLFIPAEISPTGAALLVVANEVSGSTTIYAIAQN